MERGDSDHGDSDGGGRLGDCGDGDCLASDIVVSHCSNRQIERVGRVIQCFHADLGVTEMRAASAIELKTYEAGLTAEVAGNRVDRVVEVEIVVIAGIRE